MAWFEQLGSSIHFQEHEVNKFWSHVFKAYKEFGKQIHVENSEELVAEPIFCNQNILVVVVVVVAFKCHLKVCLFLIRIETDYIYWMCANYQKLHTFKQK